MGVAVTDHAGVVSWEISSVEINNPPPSPPPPEYEEEELGLSGEVPCKLDVRPGGNTTTGFSVVDSGAERSQEHFREVRLNFRRRKIEKCVAILKKSISLD